MSFYTQALRPALFQLPPDRSHHLAQVALRWAPPWKLLSALQGLSHSVESLRTEFAGVTLRNPVGLAAGFDKDCEMIDALSELGFGFLCVGTLMPEPRFGNPLPRLVRLPAEASLADSMGLPSKGRPYALERLRRRRTDGPPVFANLGGLSAEEIAAAVRETLPLVDAVEISLFCPNVKARADFDELALLRDVLTLIRGLEGSVTVRVPNDTAASPERLAALIEIAADAGVGGLKVGGGRSYAEPRLGSGQGTLHGRAIFKNALKNVRLAAQLAAGRIAIKGNGGIRSADDVRAMLEAGAICVDLYSAFIYEGWTIARDINRGLSGAPTRKKR